MMRISVSWEIIFLVYEIPSREWRIYRHQQENFQKKFEYDSERYRRPFISSMQLMERYCNVIIALIHRNKVDISFFRPVEPCGFFPIQNIMDGFITARTSPWLALSLWDTKDQFIKISFEEQATPPTRSQSDSNRSLPSAFNRPLYIQRVESLCYMRDNNNRERKEQHRAHPLSESFTVIFLSFSSLSPLVAQQSAATQRAQLIVYIQYIYVLYIYIWEREKEERGGPSVVLLYSVE